MNERIGIMADSHGDAAAIEGAMRALWGGGCGVLVHLGDVCESSRLESADRCVALLRDNNVAAVKGNNDHAVVANREGLTLGDVSAETVAWLKALPLKIRLDAAVFVHSLPFVREMGLSAMVREMDLEAAALWFARPRRAPVLFRGHNHAPRLLRLENGRVAESSFAAGDRIGLDPARPVVVTCGAVTAGLALIFDPASRVIDCVGF